MTNEQREARLQEAIKAFVEAANELANAAIATDSEKTVDNAINWGAVLELHKKIKL